MEVRDLIGTERNWTEKKRQQTADMEDTESTEDK